MRKKKKLIFLNILTYLLFSIIIGRLFYLQIIDNNYYLEKLSSRNNKIVYEDSNLRGRIYDKNNKLLVDNKLILTIYYQNTNNLSRDEEIELAYLVSKKIDLDYHKLTNSYLKDFYLMQNDTEITKRLNKEDLLKYERRMISNSEFYNLKKSMVTLDDLKIYNDDDKKAIYLYYLMNNNYSYMEKIIKENASYEEFMYFSENSHHLNGFNTKFSYGREYLYGDTLRGIIGNIGSIPKEYKDYYVNKGYEINDIVGLSNIEYVYDDILRGSKNIYLINNNEKRLIKKAIKGKDIRLTIDIELQKFVDNVLSKEVKKAKSAYNAKYYSHSYVMVTDTLGKVLVMSGKEYNKGKIIDSAIGNVTDTITPGSVVKAASMIVGFDTGAIKIGEVMKDECIKIKDTPKKCSVYTMGNINDINALAYSSNVYQFKTAMKVAGTKYRYNGSLKINEKAFDTYREYFGRFGLGVKTGIELPNESTGFKGSSRTPGLLLNFAIGQYDTYTNAELNQYISTVARGERYKLHLLDAILDNEGKVMEKIEDTILNKVDVPDKYLNRVREGLKAVTTYGSGKHYVNISAAGKTGTSESFYDSNHDGKIDTETISTNFVMYTPINNPKYAISINSPNISTPNSGYKYPINQNVIREITDNLYKFS